MSKLSLRINIIGTGRLGLNLARAINTLDDYRLVAIFNRCQATNQLALKHLKGVKACHTIAELPKADVTFITTPDDKISEIALALSKHPTLSQHDVVCHMSGVHDHSILKTVLPCHCASIHPMQSFTHQSTDFNRVFCGYEGDSKALALLTQLFKALGATLFQLNGEQKVLYHIAGVFASNYLITLNKLSVDCLEKAGIAPDMAKEIANNLMLQSLNNLVHLKNHRQSLTGPLSRGDTKTIARHCKALEQTPLARLYRKLGLATLELCDLEAPLLNALRTQLSIETVND